ncbi:DUF1707 SHOCT-like domain-containing protein [Spongiactinospora rosea]|uniref:DUF1707 SHOCT-like domain-containing protein n=1 Tax=Spongiactinospora rosea TaxID=2248750 RepID=UPI0011C06AB2|nr:DUF1707 domain-containing protein [Spongiactinospora rosea]
MSDVERDRASEILREHFAVGRLRDDELMARLDAAQTARNWGDLQRLLADLPPIPGMALQPVPPPYQGPPKPPRKPGAPYSTAAWVCFGLGFVTCGVGWIPAIVFALMATSANKETDPEGSRLTRNPGAHIGGVIAGVLASLVAIGVVVDTAQPVHEITMQVIGEGGAEVRTVVDGDSESTSTDLPYSDSQSVKGSFGELSIRAQVPDDAKDSDQELTCVIKVDGVEERTSSGKGGCSADYEADD